MAFTDVFEALQSRHARAPIAHTSDVDEFLHAIDEKCADGVELSLLSRHATGTLGWLARLTLIDTKEFAMTALTSVRPAAEEHDPYYGRYIDLVADGDILDLLERQIDEFTGVLGTVPADQAQVLHAPYTWTIAQVVGHLIDVEKVFGYRAHRFACDDLRPILGMEQNEFVDGLDYGGVSLADLSVELKCARRSNLLFLKRISAQAWSRTGTADGNTISVRACAFILVGHVTYHLEIIKRRVAQV